MRKLQLMLILLAVCGKLSAQILKIKQPKILYGFHAQTSTNAPFFISYYHLNSDNKGWGVKAGYGRENEVGYIYYNGNRNWPSTIANSSYVHKAEYFYVTPQYLAYAKDRRKSTFIIAFGLPLGMSRDRLTLNHRNDPVKGSYYVYKRDENKYVGLEVELAYWANLGKKMVIKYGLTTGMKLIGDAPFQEEFQNYNFDNVYYPGMYKTSYLNLQIGLLFSQIKNNKAN
ncbi:MAG: hypothetical protein Q8R57_07885 [Bacteroidota bacterium]|nr:hypothetical protein [Bacteroidota bacterium]